MSYETILQELKDRKYKPVYWLEGEEDFFIDQLSDYIENNVLSEAEKGFNLTVFYGKDANWSEVVNACRRYPMFAELQVVMLKEAQVMKDLEKLEMYIEKPLSSTLLVVAHKQGKLDGRTRLAKLVKEKGEVLSTRKLYDNQLPEWVVNYTVEKGFSISEKACLLLVDHIGNDLSRMINEIDKLLLNIRDKKNIDDRDIEKYVGISREYNVFELQAALGKKDMAKAMKIIQYFAANPKAAPIQMVLPALYAFFQKVWLVFGANNRNEREVAAFLGLKNSFFVKDYLSAAKNYGLEGAERAILLLHQYNLRSIGINDAGYEDGELLKEMVFKLIGLNS